MRKIIPALLLTCSLLLAACSSREIRPGVFVTDDPSNLPLPTSGYRLYIVGETHGNRETKSLFTAYLELLHDKAGVRDVILEEDQAYEEAANAFVMGEETSLIPQLCLRRDVLSLVRDYNLAQMEEGRVRVHLVDVDSPLSTIYLHLRTLQAKLESSADALPIPTPADFESWSPAQMYDLVDALSAAAVGDEHALNGFQTIRSSIQWYWLGNRMETGPASGSRFVFAPVREDIITNNVQFLLNHSDADYLVFYGSAHGMKMQADPNPPRKGFKSWAQRIFEAGFPVFSLDTFFLSGGYSWRGSEATYSVPNQPTLLPDGTDLAQLLIQQDENILYVDFRVPENMESSLPSGYADIPAGQVHDGQVIFKTGTPMEDACK